jgi:hypothetical protein
MAMAAAATSATCGRNSNISSSANPNQIQRRENCIIDQTVNAEARKSGASLPIALVQK